MLDLQLAELQGNIVYDLSGNGNNGTIYGATWKKGPLLGSLYFDGVDDYVKVHDSVSLDITKAITIEALIYPITGDVRINFISKPLAYRLIRYSDNRIYFQLSLDGNWAQNWLVGNTIIPLNKWTHVVGTYDSSLASNRAKIYVNGVIDAEGNLTGTNIDTSTYPLYIGYDGFDYVWDGYIAFVRIYNRALSEEEINTHYRYLMGYVNRIKRRFKG